MSSLQDLLMRSVRQLVLDHLPYDRHDDDVARELSAMTPSELLIRWLNWTRRMLPQAPRQVLQSNEFAANPVAQTRRADIQAFVADIQSGADLTKYLSRRVKHGYVNTSGIKPHRRKDLDLMLSAWGVHHLHFSQDVESDGFVNQKRPIIFAVFRRDRAFLIDVMNHGDWSRDHVVRVMVNNWPDEGLFYELRGIHGLSRSVTDEERKNIRNSFVNAAIEIGDKVYMPGRGLYSSGIGIDVVLQVDRAMFDLEAFALRYEQNPEEIIGQVTNSGISWPDEPEFTVAFEADAYGVIEIKSGTFLRLGP